MYWKISPLIYLCSYFLRRNKIRKSPDFSSPDLRLTTDDLIFTEVKLNCGLLQGGVSSTHLLPHQGGREARPPGLLQGLSPEAKEGWQAGEDLLAGPAGGQSEAERHGPGQERSGHPGQRGVCREGGVPRERGVLAPHRHALGRDEVCLLRLQGEEPLIQMEFFLLRNLTPSLQDGQTKCKKKHCPTLNCRYKIKVQNSCCHRCAANSDEVKRSEEVKRLEGKRRKQQRRDKLRRIRNQRRRHDSSQG